MSAHDSYSSASDEPMYEIDSFELLWEQHKGKIIAGAVAAVLIVLGVFGWILKSNADRKAAEEAFSVATTPDAWREIIAKYPKSPVAGNAALLLAQSLREKNNIDEANQVLSDFVSAQPRNPFAPLASLAIAENEAQAGKIEEAKTSLGTISQTEADSFVAPFALMLKAELHLAQWERDGALKTYEELYGSFPDTVSGNSAEPQYNALKAMSQPAAASPASAEAGTEQAPAEASPAPTAQP